MDIQLALDDNVKFELDAYNCYINLILMVF
jgi:hypothetical protein